MRSKNKTCPDCEQEFHGNDKSKLCPVCQADEDENRSHSKNFLILGITGYVMFVLAMLFHR